MDSAALQRGLILGAESVACGKFPIPQGREFGALRKEPDGSGREDRRD